MLRVEDVAKVYENPYHQGLRQIVLRGVTFSVEAASTVFLVGPSGSGKSTLLRLIAAIEEPTAGQIVLEDIRVDNLPLKKRLRYRQTKIGMLLQNPPMNVFSQLTVAQNIAVPLKIAGILTRQERSRRIRELLDLVGLAGYENRRVWQLSGGQLQRIAVCIALANHPRLILADEPTGELDSETAHSIIKLFIESAKYHECASLIVTHNHSLIPPHVTVYHLSEGLISSSIHYDENRG